METNEAKTLLVAVDQSDPSRHALEKALLLGAEQPDAELHVLRVMAPTVNMTALPDVATDVQVRNSVVAAAMEGLRHEVLEAAQSVEGQGPEFVRLHVRLGAPAELIPSMARDINADLIIVGTHGRTGVARMALGSTAEAVVRHAPCPVRVERSEAGPN